MQRHARGVGAGDSKLFGKALWTNGQVGKRGAKPGSSRSGKVGFSVSLLVEELLFVSVPDWSHVGITACLREPKVEKCSARDLEVHLKMLDSLHILTGGFRIAAEHAARAGGNSCFRKAMSDAAAISAREIWRS